MSSASDLELVLVDMKALDNLVPMEFWIKIEAKLTDIILNHILENDCNVIPLFEPSKTVLGHRVIKCEDPFSKDFLEHIVKRVSNDWQGAELGLIPFHEIASRPKARIELPDFNIEWTKILSCLQTQNPMIPMNGWSVISATGCHRNRQIHQSFVLLINEQSIQPLLAASNMVKYGIYNIKISVGEFEPETENQSYKRPVNFELTADFEQRQIRSPVHCQSDNLETKRRRSDSSREGRRKGERYDDTIDNILQGRRSREGRSPFSLSTGSSRMYEYSEHRPELERMDEILEHRSREPYEDSYYHSPTRLREDNVERTESYHLPESDELGWTHDADMNDERQHYYGPGSPREFYRNDEHAEHQLQWRHQAARSEHRSSRSPKITKRARVEWSLKTTRRRRNNERSNRREFVSGDTRNKHERSNQIGNIPKDSRKISSTTQSRSELGESGTSIRQEKLRKETSLRSRRGRY